MRRSISLLFLVHSLACSSSEPASTATDAGTDGAFDVADGATDAELSGFKCGAAPYVKWSGTVSARDPSGSKPAVGAKLTVSACPGETLTIPDDGKFELLVPRGGKALGQIQHTGSLNLILGEWAFESDQADIGLTLLPSLFAALIPDWDPSAEPAVVLRIEVVPGATGACADVSGASFVVKDQPSAVVAYFDEGSVPTAIDGATATTAAGLVTFSNVTGDYIEVVGTKAGCTLTPKSRTQSGRVAIAPQFVNTMIARLGN